MEDKNENKKRRKNGKRGGEEENDEEERRGRRRKGRGNPVRVYVFCILVLNVSKLFYII